MHAYSTAMQMLQGTAPLTRPGASMATSIPSLLRQQLAQQHPTPSCLQTRDIWVLSLCYTEIKHPTKSK